MGAFCLLRVRIALFTSTKASSLVSSSSSPIPVRFLQPFFSAATQSVNRDCLFTRLFLSGPSSSVMCAQLTNGDVSMLTLDSQQIAVH